MGDMHMKISEEKLWRLACKTDGMYQLVRSGSDKIANRANSLSAGYKTKNLSHNKPPVGGTTPHYIPHTNRPIGIVPVGIVYTGNYAAIKDNMLHNTLLKAKG